MPTSNKHQNNSGTSLVELAIALLISSILIAGAFQAYRFTMISANREKDKSELQSDMITVSNLIEKDIRMAGCGLPGNGLQTTLSTIASDSLTLYTNESGSATSLIDNVQPVHTKAVVASAAGFEPGGGICLATTGVDTIYRVITRIGIHSGSDTVHFDGAANTATVLPAASTKAYPAVCTRYVVSGTAPNQKINRIRNGRSIPVGGDLDSINIVPKNNEGEALEGVSASENAAVLTVVIGGYIGTGGNRVFIADSSEINIRNRN